MFNALNSLTMCISGSHSSNPHLISLETLIPNNHSVWMRKCSYGWAFDLFGPWSNSFNLCRTLHALDASLSCICTSCISLYVLFWLFLHLILFFLFCVSKIPKPHKKWKIQKVWSYMFEHISHVSFALYHRTNGFMHLQA